MKTKFSQQLEDCRGYGIPKIKQRDLVKVIHKHPSVISKLENAEQGKPNKVAHLIESEMRALANFFLERKVPKEEIDRLWEYWKEDNISGGNSLQFTDPLLTSVQQTLREFDNSDAEAIQGEISNTIFFWREFKFVIDNFYSGKLTFADAEEELTKMVEDNTFRGGLRWEARVLFHRGKFRGYQGKVSKAEKDFRDALALLNAMRGVDPAIRANLWIELGDLYRRQDATKWEEAIEYYEEAGNILEPFRGEVVHSIIKRKIASIHLFAGQPKIALDFCNESLKVARKSGDREVERKAMEHKAWSLALLGRLEEAIELQQEAHQLSLYLDVHTKELAKSHRYLGDYYSLAGLYDEAQEHYLNALKQIEKTRMFAIGSGAEKEKVLRGWVLLGLGNALMHLVEKRNEAQKILIEALEIAIDLGDTVAIGLCHLRLGELNIFNDNLEVAGKQFDAAYVEFNQAGLTTIDESEYANPYHITNLNLGLADLDFRLGNNAKALEHAQKARDMAEENGFIVQFAGALLKIAQFNLSKSGIEPEREIDLYSLAIKEVAQTSFLSLNLVLNKIFDQLKKVGKKEPGRASSLSTKLLEEWKNYLLAKSSEKRQYQLEEWVKALEIELIRWDTLKPSFELPKTF